MKNPEGFWEHSDSGSPDQVKGKIEMEVDLKIVGLNEADKNSRHAGTFASLVCESSDGRIVSGCSGMSDAERQNIFENFSFYEGKIFTGRCNGIQYNPEEPHSLYFLRFIEHRPDKTEADSFEKIEEIQRDAIASAMISQ